MRSPPFQLRPFQAQALQALKHEQAHVICVAPTGSGKSLIFERLIQQPNTRALLISPLIALGRQQAHRLRELQVPVAFGMGEEAELPQVHQSKVWIVSPEKLFSDPDQKNLFLLEQWKPNTLIVDECHCISEWGTEFRPEYRRLLEYVSQSNLFQKSLWLTATLTPQARNQLKSYLPQPIFEMGKFQIPQSLEFSILHCPLQSRMQKLLSILEHEPDPGVIFVNTRKTAHRLQRVLENQMKMKTLYYHAGLSWEERKNIETHFQAGRSRILVSTSAFGMGMDIKSLKWVVLWQPPFSILSLAQMIGRAGRNSKGKAYALWDHDDFKLMDWAKNQKDLIDLYHLLKGGSLHSLITYFNGQESGKMDL